MHIDPCPYREQKVKGELITNNVEYRISAYSSICCQKAIGTIEEGRGGGINPPGQRFFFGVTIGPPGLLASRHFSIGYWHAPAISQPLLD